MALVQNSSNLGRFLTFQAPRRPKLRQFRPKFQGSEALRRGPGGGFFEVGARLSKFVAEPGKLFWGAKSTLLCFPSLFAIEMKLGEALGDIGEFSKTSKQKIHAHKTCGGAPGLGVLASFLIFCPN